MLGHIRLECVTATPVHPTALEFMRYCEVLSADTSLLHQAHMDLRDLAPLLANVFIAERRQHQWCFRLCGTAISDRFRIECTHRTVHEIFEPDTAEMLVNTYDGITRCHLIGASRGRTFIRDQDLGVAEAVHAPLLARDGRTVLVFGGVFFL